MSQIYVVKSLDIKQFIEEEILTSAEVMAILEISRARLSILVKEGKITPVKTGTVNLFLMDDVLDRLEKSVELKLKYKPKES